PAPTFEICLTGGPTTVACQTIGSGATATFGPLLPGNYTVTENGVDTTVWTVSGTGSVPVANGQTKEVTVTNTYKQAPLTVTKTAASSVTRTYSWTLNKSASADVAVFDGEEFD